MTPRLDMRSGNPPSMTSLSQPTSSRRLPFCLPPFTTSCRVIPWILAEHHQGRHPVNSSASSQLDECLHGGEGIIRVGVIQHLDQRRCALHRVDVTYGL